MDVGECERKGFIKLAHPNRSLAESLLEMSALKEEVVRKVTLDERSVNVYLPNAYDSLREALEALAVLHGRKVLNHVCLGELIKLLEPDFDFVTFDRVRYARNGINYYGKKVELAQGIALIARIFEMRKWAALKVKRILDQ